MTGLATALALATPNLLAGCMGEADEQQGFIENYGQAPGFSEDQVEASQDGLTTARNLTYHSNSRLPVDNTYSVNMNVVLPAATEANIRLAVRLALSYWSSVARVSFREVSSGANLSFNFDESYPTPCLGVFGSAGLGNITTYMFTVCGSSRGEINRDLATMFNTILHEIGHNLGMYDMHHVGGQNADGTWGSCYDRTKGIWYQPAGYNGSFPSPACMFDGKSYPPSGTAPQTVPGDPIYYSWRKDFWSSPYTLNKDTHLSIMDYDANNNGGVWGHNPQWSYISQYDIDIVAHSTRYGAPTGSTGYRPFIVVGLDLDPDGTTKWETYGFVTNSWDEANSKVREFKGTTDVQDMIVVTPYESKSNTIAYYRFYNPTTRDYKLSNASSISGWTKQSFVGNLWKTSTTTSLKIGNRTKNHPTVAVYQYLDTITNKHHIGVSSTVPASWSKTLLGYAVPWAELLNP
jgi:hypothetical protein